MFALVISLLECTHTSQSLQTVEFLMKYKYFSLRAEIRFQTFPAKGGNPRKIEFDMARKPFLFVEQSCCSCTLKGPSDEFLF